MTHDAACAGAGADGSVFFSPESVASFDDVAVFQCLSPSIVACDNSSPDRISLSRPIDRQAGFSFHARSLNED
ncbi:unnamed protein product [Protopolystoma xenopodis]|uniref:Uncharacterized protein n=1 Tax=Protopolystoma xenopodis TaxID=117903 RepID=A0A3S5BRL0_9PLAT|nr:unnamed protein product [Protopolystoma xenopodis]